MIQSRFVFTALYAAAAFILVDQAVELAVGLYPYRPGEVSWRFGAFGLATGRATAVALADALLLVAALGSGHRRFLTVWAIAHWMFAVALAGGLVVFGLDTLEMRRNVRPAAEAPFWLQSGRAAAIVVVATVFATVGGWLVFRASRREARREASPSLVVGGRS